jgi:PD-(D/E)XK nuclease superfamily
MDVEELSAIAVDCGLKVHRDLGAGMLESAYESVLVNNHRETSKSLLRVSH